MLAKRFPAGLRTTALTLALSSPFVANAQTAPRAGAPAESQAEQARQHYERGVRLYDEGAYDGARVEFEKAYQLAPSYKIFYNTGLVHKQLADYVGALRNFEAYLEGGGASIDRERRAEVTRDIQEFKARVGTVRVVTNVPGAEVFVDDVSVGRAPFDKPMVVNPGRRKFSAVLAGRSPATRVVSVAGSETTNVALELLENRTVVLVEKPPRRVPWVGWGATALLAAGAGTAGYFALQSSSDLKDAKEQPNSDPDDLDSKGSRARTLSVVADVCTVGAVVAGGVSLYYTIKWGRDSSKDAPRGATDAQGSLRFDVRPQGVVLTGVF